VFWLAFVSLSSALASKGLEKFFDGIWNIDIIEGSSDVKSNAFLNLSHGLFSNALEGTLVVSPTDPVSGDDVTSKIVSELYHVKIEERSSLSFFLSFRKKHPTELENSDFEDDVDSKSSSSRTTEDSTDDVFLETTLDFIPTQIEPTLLTATAPGPVHAVITSSDSLYLTASQSDPAQLRTMVWRKRQTVAPSWFKQNGPTFFLLAIFIVTRVLTSFMTGKRTTRRRPTPKPSPKPSPKPAVTSS